MSNAQSATDLFDLNRFVQAQAESYDIALAEIKGGRKVSHWMWYIYPQLAGLGRSSMALKYGIQNLAEAEAYLAHPVLGPRLVACCEALLSLENLTAHDVFGMPDELKLKSCATLFAETQFARATPDKSVFHRVLQKYYMSDKDDQTLELLGRIE